MEFIGAGFRNDVDYPSARAPDLGGVAIGVDLELLDSVFAKRVWVAASSRPSGCLAVEGIVRV